MWIMSVYTHFITRNQSPDKHLLTSITYRAMNSCDMNVKHKVVLKTPMGLVTGFKQTLAERSINLKPGIEVNSSLHIQTVRR